MEKGRRRMIDGINQVSGRSDCREAVVLQVRATGWALAGAAVVIAISTLISVFAGELGSLVSALMVGLPVGAIIVATTTNYWLGHCEDTLVLVKVNLWQTKAVEAIAEYPYPVLASVDSGVLMKKVTLVNTEYLMPRQFEDRFRAITGTT